MERRNKKERKKINKEDIFKGQTGEEEGPRPLDQKVPKADL